MEMYHTGCACTKCICKPESGGFCFCPIAGVIDMLGRKNSLLIFTIVGNFERIRYSELEKRLLGISPKTLSDRLKELERAGLIKREMFGEIPPRVEYSLTEEGAGLRNALIPLQEWVSANGADGILRRTGPCHCLD